MAVSGKDLRASRQEGTVSPPDPLTPAPRRNHTATMVGSQMVVFGVRSASRRESRAFGAGAYFLNVRLGGSLAGLFLSQRAASWEPASFMSSTWHHALQARWLLFFFGCWRALDDP